MREGCEGSVAALPFDAFEKVAKGLPKPIAKPEAARPAAQQGTRPKYSLSSFQFLFGEYEKKN